MTDETFEIAMLLAVNNVICFAIGFLGAYILI